MNDLRESSALSSRWPPRGLDSFVDLVRLQAQRHGPKRLYRFVSDETPEGEDVTYLEIDERARRVAAALQSVCSPGTRVLLLFPPGIPYVAAFLGCLYAGVVAVPAYPPDPSRLQRTLPRVQAIVSDSAATVVLTSAAILAMAEFVIADAPDLKALLWMSCEDAEVFDPTLWRPPVLGADSLAFLQYTSGSTGTPKGVMLTHGNLLSNSALIQHCFQTDATSVGVFWLPFYHDMGLIGGLLQTLYCGGQSTLMSPLDFLRRPLRWLEVISRTQASISGGPNFAFDLCVRKTTPEERAVLDLSCWELAFCGAEPIRKETLDRFVAAFAPAGFRREAFYPCYGLAESTLIVSGGRRGELPVVRHFASPGLEVGRAEEVAEPAQRTDGFDPSVRTMVGCGGALPAHDVVIVDPETRMPCEDGAVGEIWARGPSVARGYWQREHETSVTFHARRADGDEREYLRTGDLGFVRAGSLFIAGRLKDLVIIRGRNYAPQDIERTIEAAHQAVRPGCGAAFSVDVGGEERLVIVQEIERRLRTDRRAAKPESVPADRRGNDRRHVDPTVSAFGAAPTPEGPPALDLAEIAERIRQLVAEHHQLRVHAVVLIRAGSLPKTSSGKVQRHACRIGFLEGTLEAIHADARASRTPAQRSTTPPSRPPSDVPPRFHVVSDVVKWLQPRLARLVGMAPDQIDPDAAILRYGLDSLRGVELHNDIEKAFGVNLPIARVLGGGTLVELGRALLVAISQGELTGAEQAPRLPGADRELSYGERSLWFLWKLAPDSTAYNVSRLLRLESSVDVTALRAAFQHLVERHEILRTVYEDVAGEPRRVVLERANVDFVHADCTGRSEDEIALAAAEIAGTPFDLASGPLMRVRLWTRPDGRGHLLLTLHHIVTDFWSLGLMAREIAASYAAFRVGSTPTLQDATPYSDFVHWQHSLLAGPAGERLRAYAAECFGRPIAPLALPTDRPRPTTRSRSGGDVAFRLDAESSHALRMLAQDRQVTEFVALLATFVALLHRYSGQRSFAVGTPMSGRSRAGIADVLGYCVNTVPLRANVEGRVAWSELLQRTRVEVLRALEHQDLPFSTLVSQVERDRDPSRSPMFDVAFVLQRAGTWDTGGLSALALGQPGHRARVGDIDVTSEVLPSAAAMFDLTLAIAETGNEFQLSLQYHADLFDRETCVRMVQHFANLVRSAVRTPETSVESLHLLSDVERAQLLETWGAGRAAAVGNAAAHELFEAQAARTPGAIAVHFGSETLTYRQLDARANQLAHYLRSLGVGPESRVAVRMPRGMDVVVAYLAVFKAGGAYVPIDLGYPAERVEYMVRDAGAEVFIHTREFEGIVGSDVRRVCLQDAAEALLEFSTAPPQRTGSEALAYIVYTSGSSGQPKGVAVEHAALANLIAWHRRAYGLGSGDRCTQIAGLSFDASVWEIWPTLCAGATLLVVPDEIRLSPSSLVGWLGAVGATHSFMPTPLAELALDEVWPAESKVRFLFAGGEALRKRPPEHAAFALANAYGPTENAVVSTAAAVAASGSHPPSIGRPIDNVSAYVVTGAAALAPVGVPGELCLAGLSLARGYWRRPDLTAERFVPDPFSKRPGERMYRTGDVVRWRSASGELEYLGRADHQVKVRGFRIELGEIEAVLAAQPGVRECVVVAREDVPGSRRLVAYVVPGNDLDVASLRQRLQNKLPEYMVPGAVVVLEKLPLTPNGKVDRRALPAPLLERGEAGSDDVPRDEIEREVAAIFAEILGVSRIRLHDNFFHLGGHSLLATRLVSKVRSTLRRDMPLSWLFESPTVAALAIRLKTAPVVDAADADEIKRRPRRPPAR